jgi:tetratricopeptide (TPR) repeat protein
MFAVVMAATAAAAVSCTTTSSSSTPGKGGDINGTPAAGAGASQVSSLLRTGITQTNSKDWSAATSTFHKVLALSPGNVYANYNLGVIAQTTGDPAGALAYYIKAVAADKTFTPAMFNEAILLEDSAPQQAIALYQQIVRINPKASTAYLRMAFVQAGQGDLTDARANDAKAVALDPSLSKFALPVKK